MIVHTYSFLKSYVQLLREEERRKEGDDDDHEF